MSFVSYIKRIVNGDAYKRFITKRNITIMLAVVLCMILGLANHYHAVDIQRKTDKAESHIKELRAEDIAIESELLKQTNRRESVKRLLQQKGSTLIESKRPPYKIVYEVKE